MPDRRRIAEARGARERDAPPPRTCPKHENDPEPPPCGACADARRRWEAWDASRRQADATHRSSEARVDAAARAAAVRRCDLCDERGYLPSGRQCTHDPTRVAGRGAAAARAALQSKGGPDG